MRSASDRARDPAPLGQHPSPPVRAACLRPGWIRRVRLPGCSDVKPENLLCERINDVDVVKLGDFGSAMQLPPSGSADVDPIAQGTTLYSPPEVVLGKTYSCSADMWATGITTCASTIHGRPPRPPRPPLPLCLCLCASASLCLCRLAPVGNPLTRHAHLPACCAQLRADIGQLPVRKYCRRTQFQPELRGPQLDQPACRGLHISAALQGSCSSADRTRGAAPSLDMSVACAGVRGGSRVRCGAGVIAAVCQAHAAHLPTIDCSDGAHSHSR